jgi:hypothetical protein
MKSPPGPPMTLCEAATARVRIFVWCRDCSHQVEPDPADLARRYGDATSVLDWRERLVCCRCNSRAVDMVLTGARPGLVGPPDLASAAPQLPLVLSLRGLDRLPLQVCDAVGSTAGEREDMIFDVPGTCAGCPTRRWAGMLQLKFVLDGIRAIFARQHDASPQRDIARQRGEKDSAAQRHDRENASISVKTATMRTRGAGRSDHPQVTRG